MTTILQLNSDDLRAEIKRCFQESMAEIQTHTATLPLPDRIELPDACKITGLQKSTIYRLTSEKRIPFQKFGKRLLFSRTALDAWIQTRTISAQEAPSTLTEIARKKVRK